MHIELTQRLGSLGLYAQDLTALENLHQAQQIRLGLTPLKLHFGTGARGEAVLSPATGRISLPIQRWQLQLTIANGIVNIGPVIAIFTSSQKNNPRRRFHTLSGRFQRLVQHARKLGALAYVFTPHGVNWKRRTITGFTWTGTGSGGRWTKGTFPFPNVVYNRVPTRKAERRPRVDRVRKRLLAQEDLHLFNPTFLDKWQVHQILRHVQGVQEYLPDTRPYRRVSELIPFLEHHRHVYLKMAGGSLGNGTARVDLMSNGKIRWRSTGKGGQITSRTLSSSRALGERMRRLSRGRTYLMQQGIQLLEANGRPFDVRALVQKEPDGRWTITGMAARIAGPRQITTHRPRGGSRAKLIPLIHSVFNDEKRALHVEEELRRVIVETAQAFDSETGGGHGELSMDVAIDQSGRPWILELNAKPAIFDEPTIRKHARQKLLNYCFATAGFTVTAEPNGQEPAED